ncbi:hypothetical protein RSAG8_03144, partial [Rhizoctonia solani AG-8 WAC10335]
LEEGEGEGKRPLWSKVRWINVSGLSWDVLEALHHRYDLHPLSLDTVINGRQNARSKADYFPQHLFIHILSHTLAEDDNVASKKSAPPTRETNLTESPRQSKTYDPEAAIGSVPYNRRAPTRTATMATIDEPYGDNTNLGGIWTRGVETEAERKKEMNIRAIDALKQGTGRVEIDVRSVFMFLLRDGTLITMQREPTWEFGVPIYERLRLRDTLLRSSGDASLLLQSLVDLIVDEAVKITDKYHRRILKMERDILLKPKMSNILRDLYDEETLPKWDDEQQMPFLRAVIKEVLRWRPPLPAAVPHRLEQDDYYEGYFIPKDSSIICNIWAIHSNTDRYEDPHLFKPERFLDHTMSMAESIAQGDPAKRDHFAFGAGRPD